MNQQVIKNVAALATTDLRLDALSLAEAGYAAITTESAFIQRLKIENDELHIDTRTYPINGRRIFFVGIGKCAIAAASAVETILGDQLTAGIAFDVSLTEGISLQKTEIYIGTHPLPSETNEHTTERIIEMLSGLQETDLVLMLISGGGSALLCHPSKPMTHSDESNLWNELTVRGASIQEINTIRKHISDARGGGLAKAAYPAEMVSLIISDVPGNILEQIASGPTVQDTSTVSDAQSILTKYALADMRTSCIETPKEQKYFDRVTNILFLTNRNALTALQAEAIQRGYKATIIDDSIKGEAREVGLSIVSSLHTAPAKTVLLYAGETTVTFSEHQNKNEPAPPNQPAGGRNQEMALAVLQDLRNDELLLPFASDGRDNTDHAGAIADTITLAHAHEKNLSVPEHLASHRSYEFFRVTGDALQTGYTESNVSDIIIAIKN